MQDGARRLALALAACGVILAVTVVTLSAPTRVSLSENRALQLAEGAFSSRGAGASGARARAGGERALQLAEGAFGAAKPAAAKSVAKQTMLASARGRIQGEPLRRVEAIPLRVYLQRAKAIKAQQVRAMRAALDSNWASAEDVEGGDAYVSAAHIRREDRARPAPVLQSIAGGQVRFPGRSRRGSAAIRHFLESNGDALRMRRAMARREQAALAEAARGI